MAKVQQYKEARLDFGDIIDRTFWGLLIAIASYGVMQIQDLSKSVAELNQNMAVVLSKMSDSEKRLDKDENRLERLELDNTGSPYRAKNSGSN